MGASPQFLAAQPTPQPGSAPDLLQVQDLQLHPSERRVYQAGTPVALSALEFDLLHALMRRPGEVMSREALEQQVYTWRAAVASNAVEVHVHYLRRKLGRGVICTVRGMGYVMPRQLPAAAR